MDNDDAIVGTILSRREAVGLLGKTTAGIFLGGLLGLDGEAAAQAKIHQSIKLIAAPALTEGPFYVDERLNRANLIEGTSRASVVNAAPLSLELSLYKIVKGKYVPLQGAAIDLWHCDAHGVYSDISQEMNHENTHGQRWLRGTQVTGASGLVAFHTIFPGWYEGRTTHIHFKVRQPHASGKSTKEFTSQLFFDDAFADRLYAKKPYFPRGEEGTHNQQDNIFCERQVDGSVAGKHLMPSVKAKGAGYVAQYAIALTDESFQPRRMGPGFGPPPDGFGPPPGGFGPPPGGFGPPPGGR